MSHCKKSILDLTHLSEAGLKVEPKPGSVSRSRPKKISRMSRNDSNDESNLARGTPRNEFESSVGSLSSFEEFSRP